MTMLSVAVIWLAVGFIAAVIFGATIRRTNQLQDDEQVPQRSGAQIQYMRRGKESRDTAASRGAEQNRKKSALKSGHRH